MKKPMSFQKKLFLVFILGYLVIDTALISYSNYLTYHYKKGIEQSGNAMMNLYINELDSLLKTSKKYLQEVVQQNLYVQVLQFEEDEVKKYEAAYELMRSLSEQLTLKEEIAGFMIQYDVNKCYYSYQNRISFEDKQIIKSYIDEEIKSNAVINDWKIIRGEQKAFLALSYAMRYSYFTVIIDFEYVTSNIVNKYELSSADIIFQDQEGILGNSGTEIPVDIRGMTTKTIQNGDVLFEDGKYMIFSSMVDNTDLQMHVLLPDESGIAKQNSQFYLLAIMILVMLCMVLSYSYAWNGFVVPLQGMMRTMEKIENGQIDQEMDENADIAEYRKMAVTFNSMMKQLKALKIKTYEEKLREQKTRLQFLQLQIKPHFYLNYLKILYALLKQGKTKELEEVLISMSSYFRYVFRDSFSLVTMEEELNFTREYLNIQKNSAGFNLDYEVNAEQSLMGYSVLPLIIQTFVENSVKYARTDGKLVIKVSVTLLEGAYEKYLDIVITDNGQGYAQEWLDCLNSTEYQTEKGEHIGVLNLRKRLELYYGDAAEFAVRNCRGAVSEVIVPAGTCSRSGDKKVEQI